MIYTMAFVVVLVSLTILVPTASAENHSNCSHHAVFSVSYTHLEVRLLISQMQIVFPVVRLVEASLSCQFTLLPDRCV